MNIFNNQDFNVIICDYDFFFSPHNRPALGCMLNLSAYMERLPLRLALNERPGSVCQRLEWLPASLCMEQLACSRGRPACQTDVNGLICNPAYEWC